MKKMYKGVKCNDYELKEKYENYLIADLRIVFNEYKNSENWKYPFIVEFPKKEIKKASMLLSAISYFHACIPMASMDENNWIVESYGYQC